MDKDTALDLALEALEELQPDDAYPYSLQSKAITAIKQARALDKKAENARELGLDYEPEERYTYGTPLLDAFTKPAPVQEPVAIVDEDGVIVVCNYKYKPGDKLYTTPPAAPVQEPVAFNAGVPPLYPEMKDGEAISVEYTTPPDVATPLAAQEDIQRLSALVRAQQITIDKLEQARSAPVQEPVAHCEAGPDFCQQCHYEDQFENRSLALAAAVRYVKNNTPKLVFDEIYMALNTPPAAQRQWVGLTDEEVGDLSDFAYANDEEFVRNVEAKLREKNGGVV